MTEAIRLLIADDHPTFRHGLRALLSSLAELEIVGEAEDGREVVQMAAELEPDVVVMDLHMPERNGIEATREIVGARPHIGVLVLTMHEDDASVFAAMRAGARGYLLKGARQDEIARAIRAVAGGEAIFGPGVARRVIEFFSDPRRRADAAVLPGLTQREREVLSLMTDGLRNTEIALRLDLNQKTVRNHVSNIFHKLQVADRAEAVARAREAGLGQSQPS